MEIMISQVRWPAQIYREVKRLAKDRGQSVNSLVCELIATQLNELNGFEADDYAETES